MGMGLLSSFSFGLSACFSSGWEATPFSDGFFVSVLMTFGDLLDGS